MQPLVAAGLFSGSVLLARDGEILAHEAYGQADIAKGLPNSTATRHKIMSTTKSITAVVVLRLVQAGKLGLDDLVSRHLDAWPSPWSEVKIEHLLDHTSGLPNLESAWVMAARQGESRGLALWRQMAPLWAEQRLAVRAGTKHRYSNLNYELLGAIAEVASGLDFVDLVRTQVFRPAGMRESGFDDGSRRAHLARGYFRDHAGVPEARGQDMSVIQAAGGIFSTTGDLYRLDRALTDDTLLTAATRARMIRAAPHAFGYALGWKVYPIQEHACVRHSGGANGYVADLLRFPEDNACVVLLSNFAFAPSLLIADGLAACLFERDGDQPVHTTSQELDRYQGSYVGPASTVVVRRSGASLAMYELLQGQVRVVPTLLLALGEDRFRRQAWPSRVHFEMVGRAPAGLFIEGNQVVEFTPVEARDAAGGEVGRYRSTMGAEYGINEVEKALYLSQPAGWGGDLELVSITRVSALVLYGESFATRIVFERNHEGAVRSFRWVRSDGQTIECQRE